MPADVPMSADFTVTCQSPWLIARFGTPRRMVSWSLNRPGLIEADTVAWLQVRDADLPPGLDPLALLDRRLADRNLANAVGLMTARDVTQHVQATFLAGPVEARVLITLGLSNGLRLEALTDAEPASPVSLVGTINALVSLSQPLTDGALLEALSVATTARTAALLAGGRRCFGTGTDCLVIACPIAPTGDRFAGLHTETGRAITQAMYRATLAARDDWQRTAPAGR
jgi:adenosylcobinamide amidohydrolase